MKHSKRLKKSDELDQLAKAVMGGKKLNEAMETVYPEQRDDLLEEVREEKRPQKKKKRFSKLF